MKEKEFMHTSRVQITWQTNFQKAKVEQVAQSNKKLNLRVLHQSGGIMV